MNRGEVIKLVFKDIPPFSINAAHTLRRRLTRDARAWIKSVHSQLVTQFDIVSQIKKSLKPSLGFSAKIIYFMPNLYTKKGDINIRSKDLTNIEKMLIDVVCDKLDPFSLQIDDKRLLKLQSEKRYADNYRIEVTIKPYGEKLK